MDYIRAEHKLHSISKLLISQVSTPQVLCCFVVVVVIVLANLYFTGTRHRNHVLATAGTGKIGRGFGKNAGE